MCGEVHSLVKAAISAACLLLALDGGEACNVAKSGLPCLMHTAECWLGGEDVAWS